MTFNEPMSQCVYFAFKIFVFSFFLESFHQINIFSLQGIFKRNILKFLRAKLASSNYGSLQKALSFGLR